MDNEEKICTAARYLSGITSSYYLTKVSTSLMPPGLNFAQKALFALGSGFFNAYLSSKVEGYFVGEVETALERLKPPSHSNEVIEGEIVT